MLLLFFQVGVCLGIAYGVRIYFSRGAAAPTPPSNRLQREPQVCVCCPVEQSALSATTSGVTGTLMGSGCGATDDTGAFAARRLSHISAGQSSVGAGASVVKGVAGTWVEVEACASGSGGGRRVEAARRRARALLRAEVAAEEDTLEALELECAIADSALDTVRPSCADFDDAIAAALGGVGGVGDGASTARPSGLFTGPDGFVRAWMPPVGWVPPPEPPERGVDPVGGDRWGVKVRLRMVPGWSAGLSAGRFGCGWRLC